MGWILVVGFGFCSGLVFIYFAAYYFVVFCIVGFLAVLVTDWSWIMLVFVVCGFSVLWVVGCCIGVL